MGYPVTRSPHGENRGCGAPGPSLSQTVFTLSGEASDKAVGGRWYMT